VAVGAAQVGAKAGLNGRVRGGLKRVLGPDHRMGYLFVTPISGSSALAVFTDRQCDIGLVGYEMTLLAERVGHALTPAARGTPDWAPR